MELGLCPVAGDVSLPSGFKKHLKSVSQERGMFPWMKELSMGMYLPFVWFLNPLKHPWLCLLQNLCSEGSNTIVVTEHTPSREDRARRFGVHIQFPCLLKESQMVPTFVGCCFFDFSGQKSKENITGNMQVSILFGYSSSWLWSEAIIHCLYNDAHCMEEKPFHVCCRTRMPLADRQEDTMEALYCLCCPANRNPSWANEQVS